MYVLISTLNSRETRWKENHSRHIFPISIVAWLAKYNVFKTHQLLIIYSKTVHGLDNEAYSWLLHLQSPRFRFFI